MPNKHPISFYYPIFVSFFLLMNNITQVTATPITPEALYSVQRVNSFSISPDGKFAMTLVSTHNLETNKLETNLQIVSTNPELKIPPLIIEDDYIITNPI